jgi:hypothetical protein
MEGGGSGVERRHMEGKGGGVRYNALTLESHRSTCPVRNTGGWGRLRVGPGATVQGDSGRFNLKSNFK